MSVDKKVWILILLFMLLRFSFSGFQYYPNLDDNNQYGIYHLRSDDTYHKVIQHYQLYNVRPLAFFVDAYIISSFWNNMYIILVAMIVLHFLTAFLLKKILAEVKIELGPLAIILFTMAPFLSESTYWISASSRIVVSVFFCVLSNYLFLRSFKKDVSKTKGIVLKILFVVFNLLSVCYYEQTVVFNFIFSIWLLWKVKRYRYWTVPILSTALIGSYYLYFSMHGGIQERGQITKVSFFDNVITCLQKIGEKFFYEQGIMLQNGFQRGMEIIQTNWLSILFLVCLVIFFFFLFRMQYHNKTKEKSWKQVLEKILIALVCIMAPFIPFFILEDPVIANRNFYISYIGIAILVETLVSLLLGLIQKKHIQTLLETVLVSGLVAFSVIVNTAEVDNYKKVYEFDTKAGKAILSVLGEDVFEEKKTVYVKYEEELILKNKNTTSNHYRSMIENDWGIMGKLQVLRGKIGIGEFTPYGEPEGEYITVLLDSNMNAKLEN